VHSPLVELYVQSQAGPRRRESNHRHRRLLRARREWPRSCRAAEQRDEIAAVQR